MRSAARHYVVRGYDPETGDVHEFHTNDHRRWQDMAREMSEDLEDIQLSDRQDRQPEA